MRREMAAKSIPQRLLSFAGYGRGAHRKDAQYWASLSLEEKRKVYKCGERYVTLDKVDTWADYKRKNHLAAKSKPRYPVNVDINSKVALWQGDITLLEIDGIVNAANRTLLGGGGVDGCIHRAAGDSLLDDCRKLGGCSTGFAKVTTGHRLPAKYILHAVGPIGEEETKLRNCYSTCLSLALKHDIKSLAFCCISTGIYGYPNRKAASTALDTVRSWLDKSENADKIDRIIFCTFLPIDVKIYEELMPKYFPDDVEAAQTYSSSEAKTHTSGNSSEDESLPSKRGRKDSTAATSSGNDTDEYDDTDSHAPETRQDLHDVCDESKAETSKQIKLSMRSVSVPAGCTMERQQGDESVANESLQQEADLSGTSAQMETDNEDKEAVTISNDSHLTSEGNPTENTDTNKEVKAESLVEKDEKQEEISTAEKDEQQEEMSTAEKDEQQEEISTAEKDEQQEEMSTAEKDKQQQEMRTN